MQVGTCKSICVSPSQLLAGGTFDVPLEELERLILELLGILPAQRKVLDNDIFADALQYSLAFENLCVLCPHANRREEVQRGVDELVEPNRET